MESPQDKTEPGKLTHYGAHVDNITEDPLFERLTSLSGHFAAIIQRIRAAPQRVCDLASLNLQRDVLLHDSLRKYNISPSLVPIRRDSVLRALSEQILGDENRHEALRLSLLYALFAWREGYAGDEGFGKERFTQVLGSLRDDIGYENSVVMLVCHVFLYNAVIICIRRPQPGIFVMRYIVEGASKTIFLCTENFVSDRTQNQYSLLSHIRDANINDDAVVEIFQDVVRFFAIDELLAQAVIGGCTSKPPEPSGAQMTSSLSSNVSFPLLFCRMSC